MSAAHAQAVLPLGDYGKALRAARSGDRMNLMDATGSHTLVDTELPPVLESVAYARDLVGCRVPLAVRRSVADVVAALVGNAVRSGSGPVGLKVDADANAVRVAVRDGYGSELTEHVAVITDGARPVARAS